MARTSARPASHAPSAGGLETERWWPLGRLRPERARHVDPVADRAPVRVRTRGDSPPGPASRRRSPAAGSRRRRRSAPVPAALGPSPCRNREPGEETRSSSARATTAARGLPPMAAMSLRLRLKSLAPAARGGDRPVEMDPVDQRVHGQELPAARGPQDRAVVADPGRGGGARRRPASGGSSAIRASSPSEETEPARREKRGVAFTSRSRRDQDEGVQVEKRVGDHGRADPACALVGEAEDDREDEQGARLGRPERLSDQETWRAPKSRR
jgi:hypothetical protein